MESMSSLPVPGQAKIDSVTIAKAITEPSSSPITVTIGIRMFFSTCTPITRRGSEALGARELHVVLEHRLARAGAREPDEQRELEQRQVERGHREVPEAVEREEAHRHAEQQHRLAAAVGRQPAELHREHHDEHQPDPERRQAEAEDRAGHDRRARRRSRASGPRRRPSGMPSAIAITIATKASSSVAGSLLEDQLDRRDVVDERAAQVAARPRCTRKIAYCSRIGLSRPSAAVARARSISSACGLTSSSIGIADRVDAEEHEERHQRQHEDALPQSADGVGEHGDVAPPEPRAARGAPVAHGLLARA